MEKDEIYEEFRKEKKSLIIKFSLITIILVMLVAVAASEFTLYYYFKTNNLEKSEVSENSEKNIDAIADTLKNFRKEIDKVFLGEIDEQKVLDETIKGYVKGLGDEYSEYMTKEEWDEFQSAALGNYVGIGIYMTTDNNGNVIVLAPIKGSPAESAGLETGDIITAVNDENVLGTSSDDVSNKIKGEAGTEVKLTVLRDNEYIDMNVKREEIKVYHVEEKMLENNIGYMNLATFDEGCSDEFREKYQTLKNQGAKSLILDLRNNTGGLVDEALKIADMMIEKDKTLLITVDSKGNKEIDKAKEDPIVEGDIIVLTNEYSASASEILVGALKDNGRAKSLGTKTFGKGVIQNVFFLNDGSALKLTVNEYFTPNETKINKVGIAPDYEVELPEDSQEDVQLNKAIELLKKQ
ncbi:MAG TPA: S41 family peptidase [Candidatus Scatovivens faecipullorum]|nr:S41 family peptidase [Candidatus Scatovivens faecipullorum]